MPGRQALAAGGRNGPEAWMKRGRKRPVRMMPRPAKRGRRRHRQGLPGGTARKPVAARHDAGARFWFPGLRTRPATSKEDPANFQKPQRTVSRLRCRTWFPRSGVRMLPSGFPPKAGLHTGTETDALLHVLVRLAPRRGSRGLQGKWPLLVRAGGKLVAACGPPSTRNSLSVQEARRCAAARHSAFSSTATGHPPGQGPGR